MKMWLFARLSILVTIFLMNLYSCGSDYPDETPFGAITGKVEYSGEVLNTLGNPAAGVYAFAQWPPQGLPYASWLILDPEFPAEGLTFKLENLDPYQYMIFAMIVDLNKPIGLDVDITKPETLPPAVGAYPNLLRFIDEPVEVNAGETTDRIDIQLYEF